MSEVQKTTLYDYLFSRADAMTPLKKGLDAYALRQKVLAANVANAETSGYIAKRVGFEEQLAKALDRSRGGQIKTTDANHLSLGQDKNVPANIDATVYNDPNDLNFNGANNVDIDLEMAKMATNQIHFATAAKVMQTRYRTLLAAIRGR